MAAEAVSQLPADGGKVLTWPNITLLPFLADPKRFIALKPTNTEVIAARMNFDLRYTATPNWPTFDAMQRMSQFLLQRLQPTGRQGHVRCPGVHVGHSRSDVDATNTRCL